MASLTTALIVVVYCTLSIDGKKCDQDADSSCFKAAVYEHIIINKYTDKVTDQEPSYYLKKSLDVYKEVAEISGQNDVQLLVFPEDGLFVSDDRIDALNYVEEIPIVDKDNLITPCTDPRFGVDKSLGILRTLSCLAMDNDLYIVADIGDKVPCEKNDTIVELDPETADNETTVEYNLLKQESANGTATRSLDDGRCPEDGHFLYNTAVAFDPQGQLVLKYHKYHLFGEFQYNVPPTQEHAILETPFGSFGVYICFDKMFKDPPITLIEDYNLTNIILTTWWFDEMPFLMAPQLHSSFARTMDINLIVSNVKRLKVGSTGSGIYSSDKVITYHHDTKSDGRPVLLMANVPKIPGHDVCNDRVKKVYFDFMTDSDYNTTQYPLSGFDHIILDANADANFNHTICNGTLCCSVTGRANGKNEYLFGVSNKIRSSFVSTGYEWCEEACVIVALDKDWRENGRMAKRSKTAFDDGLVVSGHGFTTKYVYPSALACNYKLITDGVSVNRDNDRVQVSVSSDKNILMAGLYGRCYDRDPDYVRNHFNHAPILVPDF